jgi:hypothetical protein
VKTLTGRRHPRICNCDCIMTRVSAQINFMTAIFRQWRASKRDHSHHFSNVRSTLPIWFPFGIWLLHFLCGAKWKKSIEKFDLDEHSLKRKGLCCSQRPYRSAIFSNIESKMHYHTRSLTNRFHRRNLSTVEGFEAGSFTLVNQH